MKARGTYLPGVKNVSSRVEFDPKSFPRERLKSAALKVEEPLVQVNSLVGQLQTIVSRAYFGGRRGETCSGSKTRARSTTGTLETCNSRREMLRTTSCRWLRCPWQRPGRVSVATRRCSLHAVLKLFRGIFWLRKLDDGPPV